MLCAVTLWVWALLVCRWTRLCGIAIESRMHSCWMAENGFLVGSEFRLHFPYAHSGLHKNPSISMSNRNFHHKKKRRVYFTLSIVGNLKDKKPTSNHCHRLSLQAFNPRKIWFDSSGSRTLSVDFGPPSDDRLSISRSVLAYRPPLISQNISCGQIHHSFHNSNPNQPNHRIEFRRAFQTQCPCKWPNKFISSVCN